MNVLTTFSHWRNANPNHNLIHCVTPLVRLSSNNNDECCWECREVWTLEQHWGEGDVAWPQLSHAWERHSSHTKRTIGVSPQKPHSSVTHKSKKKKKVEMTRMCTSWWMDKSYPLFCCCATKWNDVLVCITAWAGLRNRTQGKHQVQEATSCWIPLLQNSGVLRGDCWHVLDFFLGGWNIPEPSTSDGCSAPWIYKAYKKHLKGLLGSTVG